MVSHVRNVTVALWLLLWAPPPGLIAAGAPAGGNNELRPRLPDAGQFLRGRFVYERNCLVCHGRTGRGDGELAPTLIPRPRSFRSGLFKYRSTPPGALPADADLERVIRNGIPGTSMPIFNKLTATEVRAVVEYLKFFSPRWDDPKNYAPPMPAPKLPAWWLAGEERAGRGERGRALYAAACASCHGPEGRGDGPAALLLRDSWDQPAPPVNLRDQHLRHGDAGADFFRVLTTGIEGTPMPAFNETLSEEQRWEIAAYLVALRAGGR
jgi:mono/diheme cytochrome c family protein